MSTPIRPQLPLAPPSRPTGPADGARAAQRAFFAQALNAAQQPAPIAEAAPAAPVVRQAEARPTVRMAIPEPEPERPLRPGSLLDIRI
ncbi:MAG: hypothetical protein K1X35_05805 [Caulobacteraceae bacterium]|nr:hypothetical protein [Caulobacteraceae bacterium]